MSLYPSVPQRPRRAPRCNTQHDPRFLRLPGLTLALFAASTHLAFISRCLALPLPRRLHEYKWSAMSPKTRAQSLPSMLPKRPRPIPRLSLDLEAYRRAPIARGGFSDVFKFYSPKHGCFLAIKRLRFNQTEQADLEALVAKEAAVLTMIEHPHILRFLGISYMNGAVCIVSPWAENGSLRQYLARNPKADHLGLLLQVASALCYLHTYTGDIIVHGDLHVDNVLISDMGTALLSDFGLSRIVPEGHSSSLWRGDSLDFGIGRVVYEAPELHDGAPRSWATDVFAFAMLIFHVFSGKPPFGHTQNYLAAVVALYGGQRPDRGEIDRRDFSDGLWRLVQRCWDHEPRERPRMPTVTLILQNLLNQRACSSPSLGSEPSQTLSQTASTPLTDVLALASEPPGIANVFGRLVSQGAQHPARSSEVPSSVTSPIVTSIIAPQLHPELAFGSLGGTTFINAPQNLPKPEDILSLLECGDYTPVPLPMTRDVGYDAFDAKRLSLADTRCRQKMPGPGRFKVICLGVLATCTVTCVAYALYAEGTGHAIAARDAEIPHPSEGGGAGPVAASRLPGELRVDVREVPAVLVFLSHASGFVIMWLKRTLKNHSS